MAAAESPWAKDKTPVPQRDMCHCMNRSAPCALAPVF